tara:strand:+ start:152 stop:868 length:717 start_codon:yes stop_codon:yes gene_type:complete
MKNIKKYIHKFFNFFGIEITRFHPKKHSIFQLPVETVFDIGANTGQYAQELRNVGYSKKIISFEPLSKAHKELLSTALLDKDWHVHNRCAIGDKISCLEINISENSYSSSLMPMLEAHKKAAPLSKYIGKENVNVIPLSSIFEDYASYGRSNFLKIDTQGFEHLVLKGIEEYIDSICGIELELSIIPLYEGSKIYSYYFDYFEKNGFELWSLEPEFIDPEKGRMLQFNATFVNRNTLD